MSEQPLSELCPKCRQRMFNWPKTPGALRKNGGGAKEKKQKLCRYAGCPNPYTAKPPCVICYE